MVRSIHTVRRIHRVNHKTLSERKHGNNSYCFPKPVKAKHFTAVFSFSLAYKRKDGRRSQDEGE